MYKKRPLLALIFTVMVVPLWAFSATANAGESCEEMSKSPLDAYLCNARVVIDACVVSAGYRGYLTGGRESDVCFQVLNIQEQPSYNNLSASNKKLVSSIHSELSTMEESLHMVKEQEPATQLNFIQPYEHSIRSMIAELKKK